MFEYGSFPNYDNYLTSSLGSYPAGAYQQAGIVPTTQTYASADTPVDFSKLDFTGIDLSGLDSLYGMNFGWGSGMYKDDPNLQYITAPISNKGNPTSPSGNVFTMTPTQQVRLVDLNTNTVIFEGTGYDAARQATAMGQNLTDTLGRKAQYDIQTASPNGVYTTVAHEKRNKSTLGTIGSVLGTVAPIIAAIATGGMSLPAQMAIAAGAGGLGAALKGDDILKGALLGGATAGIVGGTGLDKAISGALGGVGGSAAQAGGQAAANATGDIVVTGLSKAAQALGGTAANALVSNVANAGLGELSGYKPPATQQPVTSNVVNGVDQITGEIVANAPRSFLSPEALAAIVGIGGLGGVTAATTAGGGTGSGSNVVKGVDQTTGEIVVSTPQPVTTPVDVTGIGGAIPGIEDYLLSTEYQNKLKEEQGRKDAEKSTLDKIKDAADLASTASNFLPLLGIAAGSGSGSGGTRPPDTTGLNFVTKPLRPTFTSGGIGDANIYPYTPTTYGRTGGDQETEFMFFDLDPITGAPVITTAPSGAVNPATIPVKKEGGEIDDDMVKHLVEYRKNGGHNGPGQVKGIGSGQEDKIPAYLSDGEYVWSAQDVSDLGDGSNDEGVRRLDKMRQMVRRQAGRKNVKKIAKPQKGIDRMLKAVGGMA
jgi:hypothetical protein